MRLPLSLLIFLGLLVFIPDDSTASHQFEQSPEQPKVINATVPTYPIIAAMAHVFGKVEVEVETNAKGDVASAKAISGHPLLCGTSEEAAKRWRFELEPKDKNNRSLQLTFDFKNPSDVSCNVKPVFINPYYVEINFVYKLPEFSDTINHIPPESKGKRCPVHGELLKRDKVEIIYGLIEFKPEYLEAEKRLFPYANTEDYGGCVIDNVVNPCDGTEVQASPKYAEVLYCQRCRIAEAKWNKTHPWQRK
ncbi:MAG: hypothetical protein DMF68_05600 [Acidobacteria bacterium]|nr:MAG: hypothetical protein DMF68_05600 [Acidobacteriota bacterium]